MSPGDARALVAEYAELHAYALPQSFAIVPLDDHTVDTMVERGVATVDQFASLLSKGRTLAEIETEYFGGRGEQRATVWRDGAAIAGGDAWREGDAINEALRFIGVRAGLSDEFDALALVRFRGYDDFAKATPL